MYLRSYKTIKVNVSSFYCLYILVKVLLFRKRWTILSSNLNSTFSFNDTFTAIFDWLEISETIYLSFTTVGFKKIAQGVSIFSITIVEVAFGGIQIKSFAGKIGLI